MTPAGTPPLILPWPGTEALARGLAAALPADIGGLEQRHFPDGERYVRLLDAVEGRDLVLLASLCPPDDRLLALLFAADAARELGARSVGLVLPYLPYMRQDARFKPGEAVTSVTFARLLSTAMDWLATIDPHLHRHPTLASIYTIPTATLAAAPLLGQWIAAEVASPVLIGPDSESAQWVSAIAEAIGAPWQVLSKVRHGDRDVAVSPVDRAAIGTRTPVIVDDVISSGHTVADVARQLVASGCLPPVVAAVHGIFAGDAEALLRRAGVARIVTTNSVPHASNGIDVAGLLAEGVRALVGR